MFLSSRVKGINESITLKLNAKAVAMADEGKHIYNLTAGQLPFRPMNEFIELIRRELSFIKSYQYSPVPGFPELRKKVIKQIEKTRGIDFSKCEAEFDCIISNGAKHSLSNVLGALIDPGDEIVILAPYWVSYPAIINFCRGVPIEVKSNIYDHFTPSIEEIRKVLSAKTKAIIVNSPNNPSGVHYSDEWMKEFAELMMEYPEVNIISDEIYYELYYFDPKPTFFYQHEPKLLERAVIIDGISKVLASTGLRIGYLIAPKVLTSALTKLQGQTTSGASSLIQRALINLDEGLTTKYLGPIKSHLRENSQIVREAFREANLSHEWYQSVSAFYYMVDFSRTPMMSKFKASDDDKTDYATTICETFLEEDGLVMVPGSDFGMPNTSRISLVLEKEQFSEAISILMKRLTGQKG